LQGVQWDTLRVLVADDDVATREYFLNIAQRVNFFCEAVGNSTEALQKTADGNQYDIYFIDWKMPDLNGIELSQRLCDNGVDSASIVMISSTEWSKIEQDARAIGINKFLPKPLFKSDLINIIAECMGVAVPTEDMQQGTELPDFSGYHILLAEDNEVNREIVISLLEPINVRITCAENGLIALNTFAANPESFDMIFMDMQMPEMDGGTATSKIRALNHPHAKQVAIVAMTANVFREDIERCLKAGMDDHVGKPLDIDDVLEKLKKYLGRKK
jgi:FOG: CheY-like receiver